MADPEAFPKSGSRAIRRRPRFLKGGFVLWELKLNMLSPLIHCSIPLSPTILNCGTCSLRDLLKRRREPAFDLSITLKLPSVSRTTASMSSTDPNPFERMAISSSDSETSSRIIAASWNFPLVHQKCGLGVDESPHCWHPHRQPSEHELETHKKTEGHNAFDERNISGNNYGREG